jgi:hypothetical protein
MQVFLTFFLIILFLSDNQIVIFLFSGDGNTHSYIFSLVTLSPLNAGRGYTPFSLERLASRFLQCTPCYINQLLLGQFFYEEKICGK